MSISVREDWPREDISCIRQASRESGALNPQESVGPVKGSLVMGSSLITSLVNSVNMAQQKPARTMRGGSDELWVQNSLQQASLDFGAVIEINSEEPCEKQF